LQKVLLVAVVLLLLYCGFWFALKGYWLQMVAPLISMIIAITLSFSLNFQLEGRQYRFLKSAFQYYVSPEVIEKIVEDPSSLTLGGEKRELTMFFSDIAGFSTISETMEPTRLVSLLNAYLSIMTATILEYGGTVDKYVGDAVVAFWNAPLPVPDHAEKAVQAAMECQRRLSEMVPEFLREYGCDLKTRIGLNTGAVSVGNFGSNSRFNYTVMGDAANLASRLEGVNKVFGTSILISQSTFNYLKDKIKCRKIGEVRVVGKSESVVVYEPISVEDPRRVSELVEGFSEGFRLFEQKLLQEALEKFRQLEKDDVAQAYVRRIMKELKDSSLSENWSPVWSLAEK
jgi:adenylate cyclase